jgi:hypothetical protein
MRDIREFITYIMTLHRFWKYLLEQNADFLLETFFQDVEGEHCPDVRIAQSL